MEKVVLGMSGGVDSSVSAILLQEQGYEVIGVTMKLFDNNEGNNESDAKKICDKLRIKHYVVDCSDEFNKYVIQDFIEKYVNAQTPNPCIECNRFLKFGAMFEKAKELGAKYIATGHYAKVEYSDKYSQFVIKKSKAEKKDQSYFLCNIEKSVIPHIIFPLNNFEDKQDIRDIAINKGLEVAKKKDSQEICFISNNNYIDFLKNNLSKEQKKVAMKKGNIVDCNGCKKGEHCGIVNYTIGQRKGLGIQNPTPLYVNKIDKQKNEVVVGEREDIYTNIVYTNKVNWLVNIEHDKPIKVLAKVRYLAKPAEAIINFKNDGRVEVVFEEKQMAVTPGQSIAFYDSEVLLGGAKIEQTDIE